MLVRQFPKIRYSDITPKEVYVNRRRFLQISGTGAALAAAGGLNPLLLPRTAMAGTKLTGLAKSPFSTTEKMNSFEDITTYNNFYELGVDKSDPSKNANRLKTSPWTLSVEGEVAKPFKLDQDAIMKLAPLEERIFRHRCVEAWSIVVPWIGYSLSAIINRAEPTAKAKYVAFESFYDSKQMLNSFQAGIQFPYVEGLRMDEAMHPLTTLGVGLYGETLPAQNGAPVRLVVPWKYGFKSIKSIVKIRFVEKQPPTTWNLSAPQEYGFYSNVNPQVDHPRWSQAKERRLGDFLKRPTLPFNGYGDQVAKLYAGMDLRKNY